MKLVLEAVGRIEKERGTPRPAVTSHPHPPPRPHSSLDCPTLTAALVEFEFGRPGVPSSGKGDFSRLWFLPVTLTAAGEGPKKLGSRGRGRAPSSEDV